MSGSVHTRIPDSKKGRFTEEPPTTETPMDTTHPLVISGEAALNGKGDALESIVNTLQQHRRTGPAARPFFDAMKPGSRYKWRLTIESVAGASGAKR